MALPERLQDFLDSLDMFRDRTERIQALISIAERFQPSDEPKPYGEEHRVPGCESEAFVWARLKDGRPHFSFAVENPQGISAMALAVILDETLSGETKESIATVPDEVVYELFGRELSMGKSMGLMGMVQMVKRLAANT